MPAPTATFAYSYAVTFDNGSYQVATGIDLTDLLGGPGANEVITDSSDAPVDNQQIFGDIPTDQLRGVLSGGSLPTDVNTDPGTYLGLGSAPNGSSGIFVRDNITLAIYYLTNQAVSIGNVLSFVPDDPAHGTGEYFLCFMPGTLIRTPEEELPVEALKSGDLVTTTDGRAVPVRWIGRQTASTKFADPLRVAPIRIKAGALDEAVPARDLLLSPDHAILLEGVLVQAGALVNGNSIVRESNLPDVFTYYHVEVDDHSLILAENVPAETFIDNVDRLAFDNWNEHVALYPEGKAIVEMPYPRAKAYRQVPPAIREKLGARGLALYGADISSAA